jgi:hypothetical protein
MCFGNEQTSTSTSTYKANPAVANAATGNINFVKGLQDKGFQGYTGPQVANFSGDQKDSFGLTKAIVGNGTAPRADAMIGQYASAPAQSVNAGKISEGMSPYMNEYVMRALAPQMAQMDISNARDNAAVNSQATSSGAFGDARAGIEAANTRFNQNVQREGVIGQAYDKAFNTAIGASAQDVGNKLTADNASAGYAENALGRALGGSQALQGLQNQQLGVAGAENQMGQQQTAQDQAGLTAQYNQWLMAQQYPFQTAQLMNSTVGAGGTALGGTTTKVEEAPNNSGYALVGAALGTAAKLSDARVKDDINIVGRLVDGTRVFSYHYKGDPTRRKEIGLMAQDVKKRTPEAVITLDDPDGTMMVDYGRATERSRLMAMNI